MQSSLFPKRASARASARALPDRAHGLASRRRRNASLRAIGEEPVPGRDGGLKRYARWLKRAVITPITIKDPERYMHCTARANYWIDTGQVG